MIAQSDNAASRRRLEWALLSVFAFGYIGGFVSAWIVGLLP